MRAEGIAALLRGDADIAEASHPVNDSEKEQFKKESKTLVEVTVASDAVEILVSPSNPISSMTMEQVRGIFTGRISNWKEVGGLDGKINLYGREKASGTNAFLKEHALRGENYATTITEFSKQRSDGLRCGERSECHLLRRASRREEHEAPA